MTDNGYVNRAFRPQPGRKYWNHMAKHSPGEWHRYRLLSNGQYIKTSNPNEYRWKRIVGETGPELINLRADRLTADHLTADSSVVAADSRYLSDPEYRRQVRAKCLDEMEDTALTPDEELKALTCHCGRIACRHHQEYFYPPPHHRGSAADVEHHWPGCGHE